MATDATQQEYWKKYGQIVAKSWADPAFKQRLMTDTRTVLLEHGIEVPEGVKVQAVENTEQVLHLPLPPQPENDLTDEQLQQVAGGSTASSAGSAGSVSTFASVTFPGTLGTFGSAGSAGSV